MTTTGFGSPGVDALVVATHRGWVADEFAPACTAAGVALVRSHGFDVPNLAGFARVAWWTPTEHAARLLASGADFGMQAPGPGWLSTLPQERTGRAVWTGTLADLAGSPARAGWCKPAEFKHPDLPATWWADTTGFAAAATALGIGPDAVVQVADRHLDITWEHRVFIAHRRVVGLSAYVAPDGSLWTEGMTAPRDVREDVWAFAVEVAASVPGPDGYVLDVASTDTGPVVLEANPAFSSAIYGVDPAAALHTLGASADPGSAWVWAPDPYLVARAGRQRPLPRR